MCCALSDGGPSISELIGVESKRSPGGVGSWIKGFEDQRRRWVGVGVRVGVGVGGVARMSKLRKSVEDRTRVLDSIFELKIIHARELLICGRGLFEDIMGKQEKRSSGVKTMSCAEIRRCGRKRSTTRGYGTGLSIMGI
jgi:hypothetical protein